MEQLMEQLIEQIKEKGNMGDKVEEMRGWGLTDKKQVLKSLIDRICINNEKLKEQECLNLNTIGELSDKVDEVMEDHYELTDKQAVLEALIEKICKKNEELKKENKKLKKKKKLKAKDIVSLAKENNVFVLQAFDKEHVCKEWSDKKWGYFVDTYNVANDDIMPWFEELKEAEGESDYDDDE